MQMTMTFALAWLLLTIWKSRTRRCEELIFLPASARDRLFHLINCYNSNDKYGYTSCTKTNQSACTSNKDQAQDSQREQRHHCNQEHKQAEQIPVVTRCWIYFTSWSLSHRLPIRCLIVLWSKHLISLVSSICCGCLLLYRFTVFPGGIMWRLYLLFRLSLAHWILRFIVYERIMLKKERWNERKNFRVGTVIYE